MERAFVARPIIVSLLWPKNEHLLAMLVQTYGYDLATGHQVGAGLQAVATAANARIFTLSNQSTPQHQPEGTQSDAAVGSVQSAIEQRPALSTFDTVGMAALLDGPMQERLQASIALIDQLETLSHNESIAGLLVNETDLPAAKTAALWARNKKIPTFLVSHGSNIGEAYTVTRQMIADYLLVFGERGTEPYLDMGVARESIIVTGNPAWDGYPQILASRNQYREAVISQLGLPPGVPIVVFATTWNAKLTALQDQNIFEKTLRAFLGGCKVLRDRGVNISAIVKDRPSNAAFGKETVQRVCTELGIQDVRYADGDMPVFLCAADVLVGYDSNVFVEAMVAGVPAVGIWSPSTWLIGPALDRRDGIPMVQEENAGGLADVIASLTDGGPARTAVLDAQQRRLPHFHLAADGRSGERAASEIARRLGSPGARSTDSNVLAATPARPAWNELTNPRSVAEKGGTQEYYDHPRHELIALLDHLPRLVLDIGCAGGATALELKKIHPNVMTHGIELSEEAAALASKRMDRVLLENVEQMDFTAFGYLPESIDVVFLPDVLEHLYNPWQLLVKLKPYLSKDAQVLASIPNVRNAWLVTQLISGKWDYVEEGLLDVTHIRFFTLKGVIELFSQTGYSIERLGQNIDGRMPEVNCPPDSKISFDMGGATFKEMSAQDIWELRTFQFLVDAKPVR